MLFPTAKILTTILHPRWTRAEMNELVSLPACRRLSSRIISVLGMNPGRMTLQGTNTYILGTGESRFLIDAGEGKPEYISQLEATLHKNGVKRLSDILLTHYHYDHVGGLGDVLSMVQKLPGQSAPPTIWKRCDYHPVSIVKAEDGTYSTTTALSSNASLESSASSSSSLASAIAAANATTKTSSASSSSFTSSSSSCFFSSSIPIRHLRNGQVFSCEGATVRTVYAPGHTKDHVCFVLEEDNALFSGDAVLGHGTAVVTDLHAYMQTLDLLRGLKCTVAHPAHGDVVQDPAKVISGYITHREARKRQVRAVLDTAASEAASSMPPLSTRSSSLTPSASTSTSTWLTCMEIVQVVYADVDPDLHMAAAQNTALVLRALVQSGDVRVNKGGKGGNGGGVEEQLGKCTTHNCSATVSTAGASARSADEAKGASMQQSDDGEGEGCADCAKAVKEEVSLEEVLEWTYSAARVTTTSTTSTTTITTTTTTTSHGQSVVLPSLTPKL